MTGSNDPDYQAPYGCVGFGWNADPMGALPMSSSQSGTKGILCQIQGDEYFVGSVSADCPMKYRPVTHPTLCEEALFYTQRWAMPISSQQSLVVTNAPHTPRGCYFDASSGEVRYNFNPWGHEGLGSHPIMCAKMPSPYGRVPHSVTETEAHIGCGGAYVAISSDEECHRAAQQALPHHVMLNVPYSIPDIVKGAIYEGEVNMADMPSGCIMWSYKDDVASSANVVMGMHSYDDAANVVNGKVRPDAKQFSEHPLVRIAYNNHTQPTLPAASDVAASGFTYESICKKATAFWQSSPPPK